MSAPAAIRATFSDLRTVKGRKVCQLLFEVPIEEATAALSALGGVPDPSKEVWVGIARLNGTPEARKATGQDGGASALGAPEASRPAASPSAPKKAWADLPPSQQSAIRCGEFGFLRFIQPRTGAPGLTPNPASAADTVRHLCGVASRKDLDTNHKARVIWHQLDREFLEWSGRLAHG